MTTTPEPPATSAAATTEAPSIGQARQIAQLETQRRNLHRQHTTAQQELATAREALLDGAPPEGVTQAQAKKTALEEALAELDGRVGTARELLAQMQQGEAREAAIAQLLELAATCTETIAQRNQARSEAARALEPLITRMMGHQQELFATRKTFLYLASKVAPGIYTTRSDVIRNQRDNPAVEQRRDHADAFLRELGERGADLRAVLNSWASPDNDAVFSGFDREYQWVDEVLGGGFVDLVFGNVLQGRMMKAAQDQAYGATQRRSS